MKPKNNLRTILQSFAVLLITLIAIGGLLSAVAAAPEEPASPEIAQGAVELPSEALTFSGEVRTQERGTRSSKLDSSMADLVEAASISAQAALEKASEHQLRISGESVHAQVITHAEGVDAAVRAITRSGGEVTGVGFDNTVIQAWLPVASLSELVKHDDIFYIQQPPMVEFYETLATTEGLSVINGNGWHSAGFTGTGVKVGIIDGGFEGYPSLKGSDLPSNVVVKNFVDGEDDSQVDGTSKHGTACAEIVYDIAPGATMYLAKTATNLDVEEAVLWLINTQQVDVISASIGFYNLSPGDGTGQLVDVIQDARNAGILWAQAAGNDRESHWGGYYSDSNSNNYHEFTPSGQEINFFGPGDGSAYGVNPGYYFRVFLRWDDWTNVDQDYDLHLVRWNGSAWQIIASSTNPQNGGAGQTPTEAAIAQTSGDPAPYGYIVERVSGSKTVNFEIFAPKFLRTDQILHARSLSAGMADAPAAMTVAALDVNSPYPQESYSSEGPTNGPGGTQDGGFTKPDISGFANVSTESYGAGGFNGTSSATPHVAGAATLVYGAYPGYGPSQVQDFLEGRAIDMGSPGMDTVYGYGRLYLGDPPGPAADKIWNGNISSDWHTANNWTPSGVPTSSETVLIPNTSRDPVVSSSNAATKDLTIDPGAVLDLGTRTVTVEGTLTNNGTIKQTLDVHTGTTTEFLRIKNSTGTQTKYYGVDISPTSIGTSLNRNTSVDTQKITPSTQSLLNRIVYTVKDWLLGTGVEEVREGASGNNDPTHLSAPPAGGDSSSDKPLIPPDVSYSSLHFASEPAASAQILPQGTPAPAPAGRQVELRLDAQILPPTSETSGTFPSAPQANVSMVLDDGLLEAGYGVNSETNSYQFIWLNRFTPDPSEYPFTLNEIRVMFADNGGSWGVHVGDAIDLVVYEDADGDPSNGATWLATFNDTMQAVDGSTWSVYTLSSPVTLNGPGDVLIGVIDRFVESGVTEKTNPATFDTTTSQERSWIGWWSGDPPNPPTLPPNDTFDLMTGDSAGNWLIRGYGETTSSEGIYGHVAYNGTDASDIYLVLRHYNGSSWSTWGSPVATDANGDYVFTGVPTLGSGEVYYVRYENGNNGNLDVTNYVSAWYSFQISSYTAGSSLHGGDFDIADVVQVAPDPGAAVTLPETFTWTRRSTTTDDSYAFNLYDPDDSNTTYESAKLGYVDNYTLNSLPSGFVYDKQYAWYVKAYAPDGGFGYPYYARYITFTDNGATDTPTPTATNTPTPTATTSTTPTEPTNTPTPTATLTPQPGDTSVTVSISGNQFCSGRATGVERCYDIDPQKSMAATVRFYLTESERKGIPVDQLLVYHYTDRWDKQDGPYSSGGSGNGQYVEVQNLNDFSTFALDQESGGPYLCMVLNYAGAPPVPVLDDISNTDGDGDYTVRWNSVNGASSYTLEEDDNSSFSSPSTVYTGSGTFKTFSDKPLGTYYYRVRAENNLSSSGWSGVKSTAVTVEKICEQHNFGKSYGVGIGYSGITHDFSAQNDMHVNRISVKSVLGQESYMNNETVYIYVKINGTTVASWSVYVTTNGPNAYYNGKDVSFDLHVNDTITYFIREATASNVIDVELYSPSYVKLCGTK